MPTGNATAALMLTLALAGCDSDGTEPQPCTDDVTSVEATISTGDAVVFDWTPACAVVFLLIEEGAADRWSISDPGFDENTIEPPVTYGQVPAGAEEGEPPATLQSGVTYDLVLWRLDPNDPNTEILLANEQFSR